MTTSGEEICLNSFKVVSANLHNLTEAQCDYPQLTNTIGRQAKLYTRLADQKFETFLNNFSANFDSNNGQNGLANFFEELSI